MPDITPPAVAPVAAVNAAVERLNAALTEQLGLEDSALAKASDLVDVEDRVNRTVGVRAPAEREVADAAGSELAVLREIAATNETILSQLQARLVAEERLVALQAEYASVGASSPEATSAARNAGYAAETAQLSALLAAQKAANAAAWDSRWIGSSAGGAGGGGGGGTVIAGGASQPEEDPVKRGNVQRIAQASTISEKELAATFQMEAANVGSLNTQMTRHGYLASEAIQAAAQGELTYREWGTQILGTAAKFGAWTAVSVPIFGAIAAMKELYDGAVQTSQGIAFMKRSIDNLNVDQATSQMDALARHFNLPISDVATAIGTMGRVFHDQSEATDAAASSLYAVKLGMVDVSTATTELTAIVNAFKLPAGDLQSVFDQINQAQLRFGTRIQDSMNVLATAGGVWRSAGGDLTKLLDLFVVANRVTYVSGSQFGTSLAQAISQVNQPAKVNALAQFGLVERNGNFAGPGGLLDQAIKYVNDQPADEQAQAGAAVARAFGNAKQTRSLNAIFSNPALRAQVEAVVNPEAAKGASETELQKELSGASQLIARLGIDLQLLGSKLANSGLLTGFGLILHTLDAILYDTNVLLGAFDSLPKPLRDAVSLYAEFLALSKAAKAVNIGQGLAGATFAGSGWLRSVTSPSFEATANKELLRTAQNQFDLQRGYTTSAGIASARANQGAIIATRRRDQTYSQVTATEANPAGLAFTRDEDINYGALSTADSTIIKNRVVAADEAVKQAEIASETTALQKQLLVTETEYLGEMKAADSYAKRLAIATARYGEDMAALFLVGLPGGTGVVNRLPLGGAGAETATTAEAAPAAQLTAEGAMMVDIASVRNVAQTAGTVSVADKLAASRAVIGDAGVGAIPEALGAGAFGLAAGAKGLAGAAGGLVSKAALPALFASFVPGLLGSVLPGAVGRNVAGLTTGATLGAGIGALFGNPIVGGVLGAGAQDLIQALGIHVAGPRVGINGNVPSTETGWAAQLRRSQQILNQGGPAPTGGSPLTAPGGWVLSSLFGGPSDQAEKLALSTQQVIDQAQRHALARSQATGRPVVAEAFSAEGIYTNAAKAISKAPNAQAEQDLQNAIAQLKVSYEAMTGGQDAVKGTIASLTQDYDQRFANSANPVSFSKFYDTIGVTGQKAYNTYLTDQIARTGVTNTDINQAVTMIHKNASQAGYWEGQARGSTNVTDRTKFNSYADNQGAEAQKTTEAVLGGVAKDLSDSLARATNPDQISAAYAKAKQQLEVLAKASPLQAGAALRTDEQAYANALNSQAEAVLAVATATNPNANFDAKATIDEIGKEVQRDIKAFGADSATTLNEIAKQRQEYATQLQAALATIGAKTSLGESLAGQGSVQAGDIGVQGAIQALDKLRGSKYSTHDQITAAEQAVVDARSQALQDQVTALQDQGSLGAAQAGNNTVLADQRAYAAAQNVLSLLRSNPRATADQISQAEATLATAQTTLANDVTSTANTLSAAYYAYVGGKNGSPTAAANAAVKAAEAVISQGNFKTPADRYTALAALDSAKQAQYAAQYQNLQTNADLAQLSTSQEIAMYANFLKTIKNDTALKQQVKQQILSLETNNEGDFELNVGNVHLPSLYEVRRAELRRGGKSVSNPANYIHIAVTVDAQGDAKATGREVGKHVHKAVKTALKASQRSSVQR